MNESDSEERPLHGLLLPPKAIDGQKLTPLEGVKIDPRQLLNFIIWWRTSQYPKDLLVKLLTNIRQIKENDFEKSVKEMASAIASSQKGRYIFYSPFIKGASGGFMLDKVGPYLKDLIQDPDAILDMNSLLSHKDNKPIIDQLKKGELDVFYIDDGAYSAEGSQSDVSINSLMKLAGVHPERIKIFLVASTARAREQIKAKKSKLWSYYHAPVMFGEIFTDQEFQTLNKLSRPDEYHTPKGAHPGAILTSFFYKVPDNHYGWILPSTPGKPYILNDRLTGPMSISPPYHK